MRKHPIHVTSAQGKTPNTLCITWGSKKKKWQTIYNSNTQKCSKLLHLKMHIQCNYTLEFAIYTKSVELLKLYSKEVAIFFFFFLLNQVGIY